MPRGQFNFAPIRADDPAVTTLPGFVRWLNRCLVLVAEALPGPKLFALGNRTGALTLDPTVADLTTLTVTGTLAIAVDGTKKRGGRSFRLELLQDATGGHAVTFSGIANAAPAVSTTANKKTLIDFTDNGTGSFVAAVLASAY